MRKILLLLLFPFLSCVEDYNGAVVTGERLFVVAETPVFESPLDLAADPSILKSGDTLFLYYSAEGGIGVAYSLNDGETWNMPDNNAASDYLALARQPDNWDNTLETVEVLWVNGTYQMYYTGYREGESDNEHVENYEIGLAESSDGFNFVRHPQSVDEAILKRNRSDDNALDRHAMTSPGIVFADGVYHMIYAGWNVANDWTGPNAGIRILGATSTDGVEWNKVAEPIILPAEVTYSPDINEASLLKADDGTWYIPFSTDRSIGIARSSTFAGAYEVYPRAIVSPNSNWASEVTAPDAIITDGKMRIWYHGVKEPEFWPWVIGYSEADYPLEWN